MKIKYTGETGFKCLDLVLYGIMKPSDILTKGMIITIPDELDELIIRLKVSGNYQIIEDKPKTIKKPKKTIKKSKKEEKKGSDD